MVLLASVLKPVDDTRMRGKFAETLRSRPGTAVHIAGREAKPDASATDESGGIYLHPIFCASRLSLDRLAAQGRYWRLLRRIRPDLVVVHAPELLPITLLWQWLGRGRKFIYDIRENYALNVSTQRVYGGLVRRTLAACLRWVEGWAARRACGLTLAEESYAAELPFLSALPPAQVVLLENKYQPAPDELLPTAPISMPSPEEPLRLLYSGTISELNGVWDAIALTQELNAQRLGRAQLTIVGFCQQPALLTRLQTAAAEHREWLTLIGGAAPVPHAQVVAEISRHHFGLLPYRPHPSTERCRPTKLFEYLAHGLPVLVPANPLWEALVRQHGAGLVVDFQQPTAAAKSLLHSTSPFYPHGVPTDVFWMSEATKLWHLLDATV